MAGAAGQTCQFINLVDLVRKALIFVIAAVSLSSCVTLPQISPMQAEWAHQRWPDMDMVKLQSSRELYMNRCSACHGLSYPRQYTIPQWDEILKKMAPKAKLNAEEKEQIRRYLVTARTVAK